MRTLQLAPDAALDPRTQRPRVGSYKGGLARVNLSPLSGGPLLRIAREKRWIYAAIATEDLFVGMAIVRLGYAANFFAFAFDGKTMRMLADESAVGPAFAARVGDTAQAGCEATFRFGGARASFVRPTGSSSYYVEAHVKQLHLSAELDAHAHAPPALTAIAPIEGGIVNVTEKRALLGVRGDVQVAGKRYSLDGGLAGYDYTHGLLARRTAWRWAFALGRTKSGEPFGMNLVQGFVGEPECGAWLGDDVHPLSEGRFRFDAKKPLSPWQITTADDDVDLNFTPGAMHAEHKNLGLVRSRFVQPVGVYSGRVRVGGRTLELDRVLGVAEDQDVVW